MTNGEKMQVIFPNAEIEEEKDGNNVWIAIDYWTNFTKDWWNAEYKEPTNKNNLGVDCIDRAELLKAMDTWDKFGYTETGCFVRAPENDYVPYVRYGDMVKCVKRMPSVTQIRPKGHWIVEKSRDYLMRNGCCSNCKDFYTNDWKEMNYCPNCGADMREVVEE